MIKAFFEDLQGILDDFKTSDNVYLLRQLKENLLNCNRVFFCSNGGSHAIAEHITTDLNKRCGINALTLSNTSLITCLANDYSYENIFIKFLEQNRVTSDDIIILISSSGRSKNVENVLAKFKDNLETKKTSNPLICCFFAFSGINEIYRDIPDYYFYINSYNYGCAEIISESLLHGIVEEIVYDREKI